MRKHTEITSSEVRAAVEPLSNEQATHGIFSRHLESREPWYLNENLNTFAVIGPIHEDDDDQELFRGSRNLVTQVALRGAAERLNALTLVKYGRVSLPTDVSKAGLKEFLYDPDVHKDEVVSLILNEKKRFSGATKRDFQLFFESEKKGITVGVEGLALLLNMSHIGFLDTSSVADRIDEAVRKLDELSHERYSSTLKDVVARGWR
jgi:hypothetical protein